MMRSVMVLCAVFVLLLASDGMAAEKLRIATEGAYPPFNMKDANGELVGFDVEIAAAICSQMQADCEIVAQDWDGIIPGLLARKYDAIIASMSKTPERQKKVAFSDPYYSNYLQFIAAKGSGLETTSKGLKGKRLGAQRATIAAQVMEDNYRGQAEIKVYDTQEAAYLDLKSGRIDALLTDVYPGYDWLRQSSNENFEFVGERIDIDDKICIAVRKGDDALVGKLNAALKAIRENGTYQRINANYFPFDIF